MNYLYLSGECSALTNTLLPKEVLHKLLNAEDLSSALEILQGTTYGAKMQNGDIEEALRNETQSLLDFIKVECPDKNIIKFFLLPYDYDNIEVACKALKKGFEQTPFLEVKGLYDFDTIKTAVHQKKYDIFENSNIAQMLQEYNVQTSAELSARDLDYIFQKYKFKELSTLFKSGLMKELTDYILDCENISIALRCHDYGELDNNVISFGSLNMPLLSKITNGNKSVLNEVNQNISKLLSTVLGDKSAENLAKFELIRHKLLLKIIENYLYDTNSPSVFLNYVYRKFFEIENLHLIMNLHKTGLAHKIKSRLID